MWIESNSSLCSLPLGVLPADALGREQLLDQAEQWANALRTLTEVLVPFTGKEELSIEELRGRRQSGGVYGVQAPRSVARRSRKPFCLCWEHPASQGWSRPCWMLSRRKVSLRLWWLLAFCSDRILPKAEPIQALVAALTQWRLGFTGGAR